MAIGRVKGIRPPVPKVTGGPPRAQARPIDHGDTALESVGTRRAEREVSHAGDRRRRQLERVVLVVVPAAQVHRVAASATLGHAEDVDEEAEGSPPASASRAPRARGARDQRIEESISRELPRISRAASIVARPDRDQTRRPPRSARQVLPRMPDLTGRRGVQHLLGIGISETQGRICRP